jgi:hypothetical protein
VRIESLRSVRDAIADSIREAESDGGVVCVFGSLFLMRAAREAAALHLTGAQPKEGSTGWIG